MGLFFRVYQHLLPNGQAWRTTTDKTLRRFFEGLAGFVEHADGPKVAFDLVYEDTFPATARDESTTSALREWERQFGLEPNPDEEIRRLNLAAEWAAGGGQSPGYIQGILQTAGFDVFVHEWWDPAVPPFAQPQCGEPLSQCGEPLAVCAATGFTRFVRDPRLYTRPPLIGDTQCGEPLAQCGELTAACSNFLVNDPRYLVNQTLTRRAPPRIPDDPATFPYFLYIGGETFPDPADIPAERRLEFERLILKLRPLQNWIVVLGEPGETVLISWDSSSPITFGSGTLDEWELHSISGVQDVSSTGWVFDPEIGRVYGSGIVTAQYLVRVSATISKDSGTGVVHLTTDRNGTPAPGAAITDEPSATVGTSPVVISDERLLTVADFEDLRPSFRYSAAGEYTVSALHFEVLSAG